MATRIPGTEPQPTEPQPRELSPEEGRAFFDQRARALVGMSGEEFIRRLDAGEFDAVLDDPDHDAHMRLALLSSFGR
jgi:hypothetical protein